MKNLILRIDYIMRIHKYAEDNWVTVRLYAKNNVAIALMWPMFPLNQWTQLKIQRFGESGFGRNTEPIGFRTAIIIANKPNNWCGP